jgi:hypothetical protein
VELLKEKNSSLVQQMALTPKRVVDGTVENGIPVRDTLLIILYGKVIIVLRTVQMLGRRSSFH